MNKTNTKTKSNKSNNKEKRRKKLEPTNIQCSDKDSKKFEPPSVDAVQADMDITISALMKSLENHVALKESYNSCSLELSTLKKKVTELVDQRDDLIRYHRVLSGSGSSNVFKSINPDSLELEICDLKSTVGMLQKGLNMILDEHSLIKSLLIRQIKNVDKLLGWNLDQISPKHKYYCSENLENRLSPIFRESSGLLLSTSKSSNQSLDIRKPSFNYYSNSQLFESMTKINDFNDLGGNDGMATFRQLAELKIIIEILQKYSKIVIDEFRNINNGGVNEEHPLDSKSKNNSEMDHEDYPVPKHDKSPEPSFESGSGTCSGCLRPKSESNNLNNQLESTKDDFNDNYIKSNIANEALPEDQPSTVLKTQLSQDYNNNETFNSDGSSENMSNVLPAEFLMYDKLSYEKDNGQTITNCEQVVVETCVENIGPHDIESKKIKVLLLSDGHGRYYSQLLQDELGPNFSVISVSKPGALFKEVIEDFQQWAPAFSREDYVVIFAGTNNMKYKDKIQDCTELELYLPIFKHTNVIFTRIPFLIDNPSLNSAIRKVNTENGRKVHDLARSNSNILLMPKLTLFSRDQPRPSFNRIGKKALCKMLAKAIEANYWNRKQKSGDEFRRFKKLKPPIKPNSVEDTSNQASDFTNRPRKVGYKSKFTLISKYQPSQQVKKNIQTQTSRENLYECSGNMTEIENHPMVKPELPVKTRYIRKNIVENIQPCILPRVPEANYEDDQGEGDFDKDNIVQDYHHQQGYFAGIFMKNNQANMTTIKELLGQGDVPKPRKNFIQENVRRLKELKLEKTNKLGSQRSKTLQPLVERRNAQTMVSSSRFSAGRPASQQNQLSPLRNRRTNRHVTLDTQPEVNEGPKGYRSQGCQTLSCQQLEHLYEEGVIRYPSVRDMGGARGHISGGEGRALREMALQTDTPLEVLHPPRPPSTTAAVPVSPPLPLDTGYADGLHWDEEGKAGDKDYVKMNATIPDPRRYKTADASSTDPTRAPPTYQRGVVPKYLREHKKELEKERLNKAKEDECPEGHIQLPDDIKRKHLNTLKQNYAELVSQLNQLPVSTDTLRTRTRKKQIEADLDRIEAAIALFSREKVFVKADS